jgi:hypothetical protein
VKVPDWKMLQEAGRELDRLTDAGALTKAEYDRLLAKSTEAVGEHTQFLEGILMRGVELGFVTP